MTTATATVTVAKGARQFQSLFDVIVASATVNFASALDGVGETYIISGVKGAALGDIVLVFPTLDMQDMLLQGYVQAADTVELRLQNESTNTVDLASQTIRIVVLKLKGDAAV